MESINYIFNNIYHNFFTVCSLIPAAFTMILAILFSSIKNKSTSTKILITTYYIMGIFYLGWFIAAIVYDPLGAYHRWFTIFATLSCCVLYTLFFMHYPKNIFGKKNKFLITSLSIYFIIITIIFFIHSIISPETFYNFESHNYDFLLSTYDMVIIFSLIASLFIIVSYSIYQTIITKNVQRWSALGIGLTIFITIMIPSITHTLSKNGLFDRGLYQISQDFSSLTGFFIIAIIYINSTKDRTTLMTKIIAISFASFLMVFQGISYFGLKEQENSYKLIRIKDTSLAIYNNYRSNYLQFLYSLDLKTCNFKTEFSRNRNNTDEELLKQYMINSYIYESFRSSKNKYIEIIKLEDIIQDFQKPLIETAFYKKDILDFFKQINKKNIYIRKKIFLTHGKSPEKSAEELAPTYKGDFIFYKTVLSNIKSSPSKIARFLVPYLPSGSTFFYESPNKKHYIVFIETNLITSKVNIAGYYYTDYRMFLHPTAKIFLIALFIIILMVIFGFRFFFLGTIIKPLKEFQNTIEEVHNGNLDTKVNILVEDEIGYVAHAFNKMLLKIKDAEKELRNHANSLELRVEERSKKLIQAEKMASLGRMVAGIAHEINTPIGISVTANSHLLKVMNEFIPKFEDGTATKTDFAKLLIAIDESSRMINDNLDKASNLISTFKMVAADQHFEDKREINLGEYIKKTVLSLNSVLRPANVSVEINCNDDILILINPGLIYQILTNLINNSILHAFDNNSSDKKISITVEYINNNLSIIYTDNGSGISKEIQNKVFDPFFTTARNKGGTGLGLNIVFNIVVSQLRGNINIISAPGKGTSFIISAKTKDIENS